LICSNLHVYGGSAGRVENWSAFSIEGTACMDMTGRVQFAEGLKLQDRFSKMNPEREIRSMFRENGRIFPVFVV
jgi:hypothetical protein